MALDMTSRGLVLTTCAVCGEIVASKACGRCKTLYCSQHCQAEHWASGHKKMCKKIQRAGGAEQFHADAEAKKAVDAAVASCAAEGVPQDVECFICGCSINSMPRSNEGIVRGCACRGTMGLAHVACLVRQAQVRAEPHQAGVEESMDGWFACRLCNQRFTGSVQVALGWACWKTYFRRADIPQTGRGDAAATPWIFRGQVLGSATARL